MYLFLFKHTWKLVKSLSAPIVVPWAGSPGVSSTPSAQESQFSSDPGLQSLLELWDWCAGLQFCLLGGPGTCVVALSLVSGSNSCSFWLFLLDEPWTSTIANPPSLDSHWILLPVLCSTCHVQMLLVCAMPALKSPHPSSQSEHFLTAAPWQNYLQLVKRCMLLLYHCWI